MLITDISRSHHELPVQPILNEYPQTSKRRFNCGYFKQFPWIEYSINQDAVFCFSCRHLSSNIIRPGESYGNITFVDKGFRKWKDMKELLTQHDSSTKHKDSTVLWMQAKNVSAGKVESVANLVNCQRKSEVLENRNHLKILILATSYLARQGLAFRGNDETKDSSNKGNLVELLETMSELSPQLRERLKTRYGHYTSAEYQNDILHCLANTLRKNVVNSLGPYWALMVDESKDVSRKEQLSFVVRSTSSNGSVWEKPLGTFHMKKVDAESLTTAINKAVLENNLAWDKCVAQCYDGASVMSGSLRGVQARIKEIAPQVIYIHCHAHRLNLVLVNTVKNIPEIVDMFSIIQSVYVFLSVSGPRHELFVQAQIEENVQVLELERLVETRWSYWYRSVRKIKLRIQAIVNVLEAIALQTADKLAQAEAEGLRKRIHSISFLRCLLVAEKILGAVDSLSKELQNPSVDYLSTESLIQSTKEDLMSFRSTDTWNSIVVEAGAIGAEIGIAVNVDSFSSRPKRAHLMSKKLSEYFVLSTIGTTSVTEMTQTRPTDDSMRTGILYACVDKFISELDARFTVNCSVLKCVSALNPCSPNFLCPDTINELVKLYPTSGIDTIMIHTQMYSAKSFIQLQSLEKDVTLLTIQDVRTYLSHLPLGFSELLKLIDLVLTLPVTSVENERFFSCMKRVKTYMRNRCGDTRLSDLLVIASLHEDAKNVNFDAVIDDFGRLKQRRYPLF